MLAAKLKNIGKRYYLKYKHRLSLREPFLNFFKPNSQRKEFWALRDINLDISKGQVLGIIGRNGSGKTTLLKLICGVTNPSEGSVMVNGRIGALLELGAGFQDDLTGRENIYLNGSILGLSRKEIQKNFDSIIDFADIGDFIDMPIRTYSAGMYLRLGFSIAVKVNPDILLIDEMLAVGDLGFQRKSFNKIKELKDSGKTILLVSHNTDILRQLCDSMLLLEKGRVAANGSPEDVVRNYMMLMQRNESQRGKARLSLEARITDVCFLGSQENKKNEFITGEKMIIRIEYLAYKKIYNPVFGLAIFKDDLVHITGPNTKFSNFGIDFIAGKGHIDFIIEAIPFLQGNYSVLAAIHTYENELEQYDSLDRLFSFRVTAGDTRERYGLISVPHKWKMGK